MSDEWIDEQLLADDKSEPGWQRRARGNISKANALMSIPKFGQFLVLVPMETFNAYKAHCAAQGLSAPAYARKALAVALRAEGFPEKYLEYFES